MALWFNLLAGEALKSEDHGNFCEPNRVRVAAMTAICIR